MATKCTTQTPDVCLGAIDAARDHLAGLGSDLTNLNDHVADAAPKALTVVTGYPYLFDPPAATDPNATIITAINDERLPLRPLAYGFAPGEDSSPGSALLRINRSQNLDIRPILRATGS